MTAPLSPRDAEIVASLDALAQPLALAHRERCLARGMPHYYFSAGGRSRDEQTALDARLSADSAVSAAVSKHTIGMAWDANNQAGQPMPDQWWPVFGAEAEALGLIWGGRWKSRDMGHVEMPQTRAALATYRAVKIGAFALLVGAGLFFVARGSAPKS